MKVAILYATKTGTAEKAAKRLAELFTARGAEATVTNLAEGRPDFAAADAVALGTVNFTDPSAAVTLVDDLAAYLRRGGHASVGELVGTVQA